MAELEPISNGLVQVTANSRLHFGLINCGKLARTPSSSRNVGSKNPGKLFGGIGAMIRNPDVLVQIQPAPRLEIFGDLPHRAHEFVERWFWHFRSLLEIKDLAEIPCRILLSSPQDHSGLGTGTQIGLSIGTALGEYFGLEVDSSLSIASMMKRGKRSAIGVHGFQTGGFIYDGGKSQKNAGCTIGELKKTTLHANDLACRHGDTKYTFGDDRTARIRRLSKMSSRRQRARIKIVRTR